MSRRPPALTATTPVAPTPSALSAGPPGPPRTVWTAIILLAAVLVGSAAGLLSVAGGVPVPLAIIAGGGAFGGTVALMLAVAHFLIGDDAS